MWIKYNNQIINLELVSEISKNYDGKHHFIKFQLSDIRTSFSFKDEKTRDEVFNKIQTNLSVLELDI